jgi:hypothetical protein
VDSDCSDSRWVCRPMLVNSQGTQITPLRCVPRSP